MGSDATFSRSFDWPTRASRRVPTLLLALAGLLGGCATAAELDRRSLAADAAARAELEPPTLEPAPGLADQARRDVETVLARQATAPRPVEPPPVAATRAATTPIQWNRPLRNPARPRAGDATAGPGTPGDLETGPAVPNGDSSANASSSPGDAAPAAGVGTTGPGVGTTGPGVDRTGELLVELSGELYRQSTYADQPLRDLLAIAAGSLVRPDRTLSPEAFRTLTDREKEVLAHFQEFFRRLGAELDGSRESESVVAEAIDALRRGLVEEPRLTIADTALCYHVGGYGDYRAFDRDAFMAHEQQQVILYLGIEDFSSEANGKGQWVTRLSQQLVIYSDRDGIPVWTDDWQPAVDTSRNKRQDFFTVQVITLPKALSVGRYQLKIRVRDEHSGAETETAIPFEMVADPKLAAKVP